jgi:hypothetical protein
MCVNYAKSKIALGLNLTPQNHAPLHDVRIFKRRELDSALLFVDRFQAAGIRIDFGRSSSLGRFR